MYLKCVELLIWCLMSIEKDIKVLRSDQELLREMVNMHKHTGIPPLSSLMFYLKQNQWKLRKLMFKVNKMKKEKT